MKRSVLLVMVLLCASLFVANIASAQKMETATGKVTAIDPDGKGIVIMTGTGDGAMDVGTIVGSDTVVKVKGKEAALNDIKVGDTITIKYEKSTDLFAKQIIKK
jgi:Cu/Ag efflux protein CusF